MVRIAPRMFGHLAVLNAFLTSSGVMAQYSLLPPNHLSPSRAVLAKSLTAVRASSVLLPLRKPYWWLCRPPGLSVISSIRAYMIRSKSFPTMSSKHSGRNLPAALEGPFPFGSSTSCIIFHRAGKTPSIRHCWKVSPKIIGLAIAAAMTTDPGMPSSPGALLGFILFAAAMTSHVVTRGKSGAGISCAGCHRVS